MFTLASGSPRRKELLQQVGLEFRVAVYPVDESTRRGESPAAYVKRMASTKLEEALSHEGGVVLTADTVVVIDGETLGKPKSEADNALMLGRLQGRAHDVMTAVAVGDAESQALRLVQSHVRFASIDEATIGRYAATGEGWDKAGGYAIQGIAAGFIESIEGSYSSIVGLPLFESVSMLRKAGAVEAWPRALR